MTENNYSSISLLTSEDFFSPQGILEKSLPWYEYRSGQEEMSKDVDYSLRHGKKCLLEAGTGVGKSFSYLFPICKKIASIYREGKNDEYKVVICTSTKNLQDQVYKKDFPLIKESLNATFIKSAILYGRGNYICKKKLHEEKDSSLFEINSISVIRKIKLYLKGDEDGVFGNIKDRDLQKAFLPFLSDSVSCTASTCPFIRSCYFYEARRKAKDADIIFTNHHLVLQDARIRSESGESFDTSVVLPPYNALVVDEAHDFPPASSSVFGDVFSSRLVLSLLNGIAKSNGILLQLLKPLEKEEGFTEKAIKEVKTLRDSVYVVDERITNICSNVTKGLNDVYFKKEWYENCFSTIDKNFLLNYVHRVCNFCTTILSSYNSPKEKVDEENLTKLYNLSLEVSNNIKILEKWVLFSSFDSAVSYSEKTDYIKENSKTKSSYLLKISELDTGGILSASINSKLESIIYCSATLTLCKKFDYFVSSLGLDNDSLFKKIYDSPFKYKEILDFEILQSGPSFDYGNDGMYEDYLADYISSSVSLIGGGVLILFTSYKMLKNVYDKVKVLLKEEFTLLRQGEESNGRLLEKFKENRDSVLFGTDSFYQGIDVPGDSLRMVIVTKLPFPNLNDPLISSSSDNLLKEGKDPFYELLLPLGIIKLKQGCGRLIRNENDKGVVVILDSRIVTRWSRYGGYMISSLQDGNVHITDSKENLLNSIERFYF